MCDGSDFDSLDTEGFASLEVESFDAAPDTVDDLTMVMDEEVGTVDDFEIPVDDLISDDTLYEDLSTEEIIDESSFESSDVEDALAEDSTIDNDDLFIAEDNIEAADTLVENINEEELPDDELVAENIGYEQTTDEELVIENIPLEDGIEPIDKVPLTIENEENDISVIDTDALDESPDDTNVIEEENVENVSAHDAMAEYLAEHNYGKEDYEIYSQDSEWQELNNNLLEEMGREPIDYGEPADSTDAETMVELSEEYSDSQMDNVEINDVFSMDAEASEIISNADELIEEQITDNNSHLEEDVISKIDSDEVSEDYAAENDIEEFALTTEPESTIEETDDESFNDLEISEIGDNSIDNNLESTADTEVTEEVSAQDAMTEYMFEHNYGKEDYETYSQDPEWQALNNNLLQEMGREPIDYSESTEIDPENLLENNDLEENVSTWMDEVDVESEDLTDDDVLGDDDLEPNVIGDLVEDNHSPEDVEVPMNIESVSGWLEDINPNYDPFDIESPYCNNCGSCAYAVYQRLEGLSTDSCASTENIGYNSEMEALTGMEQVSMSPLEIETRLLEQGDGAHAIIGIDRTVGPGHWFNAACLDGKVVAIDGQSGEVLDWPPDYGDVVNWEMSVKKGD